MLVRTISPGGDFRLGPRLWLRESEPLDFSHLARVLRTELWIIVGALVPLLELVICWIAGVNLNDALVGAVWASAAVILITEVTAAIRSGQEGLDLVREIVIGAMFGLVIVARNCSRQSGSIAMIPRPVVSSCMPRCPTRTIRPSA